MFRFRYVSMKMLGSVHDADAVKASNLFKNAHKLPKARMKLKHT